MATPKAPTAISPALRAHAAGALDKFNMDNVDAYMAHAKPFAAGVGTLFAASVVDGFVEARGWDKPKFMHDTFLEKIDWRLYGAGAALTGYFLLDETDYAEHQETVAAVAVGLIGSYAMSNLYGGPRAWGAKLSGMFSGKKDVAPAAITTTAPAADAAAEASGLDDGYVGETVETSDGRRLRRLQKRLERLQTRAGKTSGKLQALQGDSHSGQRQIAQSASQGPVIVTPDGRRVPLHSPLGRRLAARA